VRWFFAHLIQFDFLANTWSLLFSLKPISPQDTGATENQENQGIVSLRKLIDSET
jgi:hypothetical protein